MPGVNTGKFNKIIKKGQNMKLVKFKIKNFRGYQNETIIDFENLTAFVGKNDVGKSTILESLDIFFNSGTGVVKLEKEDINKTCLANGDNEIVFSACFSELPEELTIDSTHSTSLSDEYLLNSDNQLEIVKRYKDAGKEKVFIKANHPSNEICCELLTKKNPELKKIVEQNNIVCENKAVNSIMRKAIWSHFANDLQLSEKEIETTSKGDDDSIKSIWEKLQNYIPIYSLFQSDRKNSDTDNEVQDPLQTAVKQILSSQNVQDKLKEVSDEVLKELQMVATSTLEKLNKLNSNLASTLLPKIPEAGGLKWNDVFKKVSISSNDDIPINKRGSGVKRLILLSFFQAEADKRKVENNNRGIIYAIEEPETSQHFEHQRILIDALKKLSEQDNTQVLLTTHSSLIVKNLDFKNIRLILDNSGVKEVSKIQKRYLPSPSLNEVNYLAFGEITEEYHQELYGYLFMESGATAESKFNNWLKDTHKLKTSKKWVPMDKKTKQLLAAQDATLPYYIRNRIDHPENQNNDAFTIEELKESIQEMQKIFATMS